ncbi:MAG: 50S ribosomal protein L13 [Thermoplasmatota archaeon]
MPAPRNRSHGPGALHTTAVANQPENSPVAVIDASGLVVGRLASNVAKRLLHGERITIINAENAIVTGSRTDLIDEFQSRRRRGTTRKGPFYPRMPDQIVRRTVRGMLPYQRGNGRAAFKRLRVFIGRPADVKGQPQSIDTARTEAARSMKIGEISRELGAKF